jgi:hypothetical protein
MSVDSTTQPAKSTGEITFVVGHDTFFTWFKVVGHLSTSGHQPIIALHGGLGLVQPATMLTIFDMDCYATGALPGCNVLPCDALSVLARRRGTRQRPHVQIRYTRHSSSQDQILDVVWASKSPRSPEASGSFRAWSSVEAFMSRVGALLYAHHLVPDSTPTFILSASSTSLSSTSSADLTRGLGVQAMLGPRTKSCGMMSKGWKYMQLTLRIATRRDSFWWSLPVRPRIQMTAFRPQIRGQRTSTKAESSRALYSVFHHAAVRPMQFSPLHLAVLMLGAALSAQAQCCYYGGIHGCAATTLRPDQHAGSPQDDRESILGPATSDAGYDVDALMPDADGICCCAAGDSVCATNCH